MTDKDFEKDIIDELSKLKPRVAKLVLNDKVTNSALSQEIKDGDVDTAIDNHAKIMEKVFNTYVDVPLFGEEPDWMAYMMLIETFGQGVVEPPYGYNQINRGKDDES